MIDRNVFLRRSVAATRTEHEPERGGETDRRLASAIEQTCSRRGAVPPKSTMNSRKMVEPMPMMTARMEILDDRPSV